MISRISVIKQEYMPSILKEKYDGVLAGDRPNLWAKIREAIQAFFLPMDAICPTQDHPTYRCVCRDIKHDSRVYLPRDSCSSTEQ